MPVSYFKDFSNGRMSVGQWAREASGVGLDAIDLSILFLRNRQPAALAEMRAEVEVAGMRVAVITAYPDFCHPDSAQRERQFSLLAEDISSAALVGAEMIRLTAGQAHPATGRREGIAWALEGLKQSVDIADRHGLKVVYENHSKPGVWDYADFSHPSDIFLEIADGLAGTSIGILFDTANPLAYGDDVLPLLERVIDRVVCVHASDTSTRGALTPVLLGTGLVPFKEVFSMLKHTGFKGWICIEEASGLGRKGVEGAVAFVRRAWEEAGN